MLAASLHFTLLLNSFGMGARVHSGISQQRLGSICFVRSSVCLEKEGYKYYIYIVFLNF
jgi:hypothetical protein